MNFYHVSILVLSSLNYLCSSIQAQDTLWTTYPDTSLKWEKIYEAEKKTAENIYHENGAAWMTVRYNKEEEQTWKWYYDNGNPYFEAIIIDDLLQGSYKIWYENGQLAEHLVFKDNVEQGLALFYHPNGQLAMKGNFQDGKMIGQWEFYDYDGNLPSGKWEWRFAASRAHIRVKGRLKNGKPIGKWVYKGTANQGRKDQLAFEEWY
ncbi:MAG: hypothetical protein AAF806_10205 [Bacteroidota bacterium]